MMTESMYLFLGTLATVLAGFGATLYTTRRNSPQSQGTLASATDLLLTQLQTRMIALEARVAHLEEENDAYHRLYGPLPLET